MNILMINQPLANRGDESAHRALVKSILKARKDITITVLFFWGEKAQIEAFRVLDPRVKYVLIEVLSPKFIFARTFGQLYKWVLKHQNNTWLWFFEPTLHKIWKCYHKADFVLNAPGGICLGGFQNWLHLDALRVTKIFNKPIVYYGRSFGPFPTETQRNMEFKQYSLEMLRYMSFVAIRDRKTEILAEQLGIPYVSTVDSAFLDLPRVNIPDEIKAAIGNKTYLVFVPNILIWHYAYKDRLSKEEVIDFYSQMAEDMLEAYPDSNIVMLPQTFMQGDYLHDDVHLFYDIAANVGDNRIIVIPDTYSSDIQQTIIKDARLLVGARYHSVVFAINNNVPFVALSYEHKIAGLCETLGKQDCLIDITNDVLFSDGRDKILKNTKELLTVVGKDESAQQRAKLIANSCFEKFEDLFLK